MGVGSIMEVWKAHGKAGVEWAQVSQEVRWSPIKFEVPLRPSGETEVGQLVTRAGTDLRGVNVRQPTCRSHLRLWLGRDILAEVHREKSGLKIELWVLEENMDSKEYDQEWPLM